MAKSIRHEMPYDAPVEAVAAMLADPAFREEVCRAQGAVRHDVSVEGTTVTIDQWLPTAGVPSFAKKIVGDETNIVQVEQWRTQTRGDIEVSCEFCGQHYRFDPVDAAQIFAPPGSLTPGSPSVQ